MHFCYKISKSCYRGSLHKRNSGQFLMRSILQAKEDPSPLNTNIIWFQGFIWPHPWCHMVICEQAASHHSNLLYLGMNRDQGSAARDQVFLIRSPNSWRLTSDLWRLTFCPLVAGSWFLVPGFWVIFLPSYLPTFLPSYLLSSVLCPLTPGLRPLTAGR